MTREEKIAEARRLEAQGFSRRQIAERLQIGVATASRYCNPEVAANHLEQARKWAHSERGQLIRRQSYLRARRKTEHPCAVCGETAVGRLCRACYRKQHSVRMALIHRLWVQGTSGPEIARQLKISTALVYYFVEVGREKGLGFSYRQSNGHKHVDLKAAA